MSCIIEKIEEDIEREYHQLLQSGMFWEFYPELSGDWEKDKAAFIRYKTRN